MRVGVIGAGIAGLSAAIDLAADGHEVVVFEKNASYGGRGQLWSAEGFHFDMGPSWYWMPEVFEQFFQKHGKTHSDYYRLVRLDPSYKMVFSESELSLPANEKGVMQLFESVEKGSAKFLKKFLSKAATYYEIGVGKFAFKPGLTLLEYMDPALLGHVLQLELFVSMDKKVRKNIRDSRLHKLLWFPVLFLGAKPEDTPVLYSLMNYADIQLGTWFPMGGMTQLFKALYLMAQEKGVVFHFNQDVRHIEIQGRKIRALLSDDCKCQCDAVVATGDYHHIEQHLLPSGYQYMTGEMWAKKIMSPSSLVMYLGIQRKLPRLEHHTLFFDADFDKHMSSIYDVPQWPQHPLFYVCASTKTDESLAPPGCENVFVLIPLAPGLEDSGEERERLYEQIIHRLEKYTGAEIKEHVKVRRLFGPSDFSSMYYAYKSNAYGLANTLGQTAFLKPPMRHPRLSNMFYAGQLTNPGPGLPPSLISGQVAAKLIQQTIAKNYASV